jgi:hypothetical protein
MCESRFTEIQGIAVDTVWIKIKAGFTAKEFEEANCS